MVDDERISGIVPSLSPNAKAKGTLKEALNYAEKDGELSLTCLDSDTLVYLQQPDNVEKLLLSSFRLHSLDLSRNRFKTLPPWIFTNLISLQSLNVSRNNLCGLPTQIRLLRNLVKLEALSNNIRPRLLPMDELASLPKLQLLDLRYNRKLKELTHKVLESKLDERVELLVTTNDTITGNKKHVSAGERDASLLRSQLEPLSTPQLRKRLSRTFAVNVDIAKEGHDREAVMQLLLECYNRAGPRTVRYERGIPCRPAVLQSLLEEMESIQWPAQRERPKISSERYMILQRPSCASQKAKKEAAKLQRYRGIWLKAVQAINEIDEEFAGRFTAIAVTRNFSGSPHIDTLNVAPFYGISMGDFAESGGKICVECSAMVVAEVDTKGRFAKVDGRFPHWVSEYRGTRYSLIYYVTSGEVVPQTTAVFEPPNRQDGDLPWIPPEKFVL